MSDSPAPAVEAPKNRVILIGVIAFIATCVLLLIAGIAMGGNMGQSEPGFPLQETPLTLEDGSSQVTLLTADKEDWIPFSFELGRVVPKGTIADIYIRRYQFQAPRGAIDLGEVPLADATVSPNATWREDSDVDGVMVNPAIERWYSYSYMSHLLSSKNHSYAVQLASGKNVYLQVVSYYCEPEGTGCLTLRYRIDTPTEDDA